jgi:hypothetical protein
MTSRSSGPHRGRWPSPAAVEPLPVSRSGGPPGPRDRSTPADGRPPTRVQRVAGCRPRPGPSPDGVPSSSEPSSLSTPGPAGSPFPDRLRRAVVARRVVVGAVGAHLTCRVPPSSVDSSTGSVVDDGRRTCDGGGAQVTRTGDAGRLVDELSPAMCTGWGDLGSSAHPPSRPLGVATASHDSGDRARRRPDLRVFPVGVTCRPGAAPRLGTDWGRAWGNRGTGGGETAPDVQDRRDVHVSTQGHPCPPTVGQHVDSGPDLRGRPRSPASTPVMTRMRERDRGFSNHIQGGEVALGVT